MQRDRSLHHGADDSKVIDRPKSCGQPKRDHSKLTAGANHGWQDSPNGINFSGNTSSQMARDIIVRFPARGGLWARGAAEVVGAGVVITQSVGVPVDVHYTLRCRRTAVRVNGRRESAPSPPRVTTDTEAPEPSGSDRMATTMSQPHSCPDARARNRRAPTLAGRSADAPDQSK